MTRLNFKLLLYLAGLVLLIESGFMFLCIPVAILDHARDLWPISFSFLIIAGVGSLLFFGLRNKVSNTPTVREGFLFVSLVWILMSVTGTLPYLLSGGIPRFIDAYFESVSGFTTTGSSILTDIEALSRANLFWRSLTHWMGGIGIILMVVVVLPSLKAGGLHLFSAESTKASFDEIKPRLIDTGKRFGAIYFLLTMAETLFLLIGGMPLFDSLCHSFGTVATGGFSPYNDSLASTSPYIQYVITGFMFLSGINFSLHYLVSKGNLQAFFRNEELRAYALLILGFTVVLFILLFRSGQQLHQSFRDALFQVVSIITCTGFGTTDYMQWPPAGWLIIFIAMFIGACAGSTGGGIKVVRHLLMFKNIADRLRAIIHSRIVFSVKYQGKAISAENMQSVIAFYFWYLFVVILAATIMVILGSDVITSLGSVASTMGGIGPGLGVTGPGGNYGSLEAGTKLLLTFTMIIGRLELYAFLILFSPAFWKW